MRSKAINVIATLKSITDGEAGGMRWKNANEAYRQTENIDGARKYVVVRVDVVSSIGSCERK